MLTILHNFTNQILPNMTQYYISNITQYSIGGMQYQYYSILLIQYYSTVLTRKTGLFQSNMCQYSSILQAISNLHQYSSISPEQLRDGSSDDGRGHRDPASPQGLLSRGGLRWLRSRPASGPRVRVWFNVQVKLGAGWPCAGVTHCDWH